MTGERVSAVPRHRRTDVMYQEGVIEKVTEILTSPLPAITASRERDRAAMMALAVQVLTGEVHPGDVRLEPAGLAIDACRFCASPATWDMAFAGPDGIDTWAACDQHKKKALP